MAVNTNLNKNLLAICFFLLLIISAVNVIFAYYAENYRPEKLRKLDNKYEIKLFAYISGAVVNPGVYEINQDTKLIDLIYAAGGYDRDIDSEFIHKNLNLSQRIYNEDHIFLPFISSSNDTSTNSGDIDNNDGILISLNSATPEELDSLPGVGEATVKKIIDARPYESVDDLKSIEGIGEKRFEDLKKLVSI